MHLSIICIKRIPLLRVYFSHFFTKQGTLFKDICYRQGAQFCFVCFLSGLIYNGPANWPSRRQTMREFFYYYLL